MNQKNNLLKSPTDTYSAHCKNYLELTRGRHSICMHFCEKKMSNKGKTPLNSKIIILFSVWRMQKHFSWQASQHISSLASGDYIDKLRGKKHLESYEHSDYPKHTI